MAILFKFKDWLFRQFPTYFWENDTYKDSQGKGLLQRYLTNFGIEYDDEMVDYIHNFMDILDIKLTPIKFFPFIGYTLGSPPDIGNDVDGNYAQRRFLTYLVAFYKLKGTEKSYQLLFNLLGLSCTIVLLPKKTSKKYDTFQIYDNPDNTILFDLSCEPCQEYSINYWNRYDDPLTPTLLDIPQDTIDKLQSIICFAQPIDCKLLNLNHALQYTETYNPTDNNTVVITTTQPLAYDMALRYDGGYAEDTYTTTGTNTYTF